MTKYDSGHNVRIRRLNMGGNQQEDSISLLHRLSASIARRPGRALTLAVVLTIWVFLGAVWAWDSAPWTRDQHAAVFRLLQDEIAGLPAAYPSSDYLGRIELTGTGGALDHGPYIELQYSFAQGQCTDVQQYYAHAASATGWHPTQHQDDGGETITDYGKTVQGNGLTLSVDCRDSDKYFEVEFNGRSFP